MAISLRAFATNKAAESTGTRSVTAPSAIVAGDLLLLFVSVEGSSSSGSTGFTGPTGWTFVGAASPNGNQGILCWSKTAVSGDASATVSVVGSSGNFIVSMTLEDWSGAGSVNVSGGTTNNSQVSSLASASVTTTVGGCRIIQAWHGKAGSSAETLTPPATIDVASYQNTGLTNFADAASSQSQTSAGSTGTVSCSFSPSASCAEFTVALAPSSNNYSQAASVTVADTPGIKRGIAAQGSAKRYTETASVKVARCVSPTAKRATVTDTARLGARTVGASKRATPTAVAKVLRGVGAHKAVTVTDAPRVIKNVGARKAVTEAVSTGVRRGVGHKAAGAAISTARATRRIAQGAKRATATSSSRLNTQLARGVRASVATLAHPAVRRSVGKGAQATAHATPGYRRAIAHALHSAATATPAAHKGLYRTVSYLARTVVSAAWQETTLYHRALRTVVGMSPSVQASPNVRPRPPKNFIMAAWQRLEYDGVVSQLVSKYRGYPAVFGAGQIPTDASRPYVVIGNPILDQRKETKTSVEVEHWRQFHVYRTADGNWADFEALVDAVKRCFNRRPLSWRGPVPADGYIAQVMRDVPGTSDGTVYSRTVTVRFCWTEEGSLPPGAPTPY